MFLSPEQLEELTDLKGPKAQIRWLAARGFRFEVGARHRPKVLVAEVQRRMLGSAGRATKELDIKSIN